MHVPQVRSLRHCGAEGRSLRSPPQHHQREDLHPDLVLADRGGRHHWGLPPLPPRHAPRTSDQGRAHHSQGKNRRERMRAEILLLSELKDQKKDYEDWN